MSLDLFLLDGPVPPDEASGRRLLDDVLAGRPGDPLAPPLEAALADLVACWPDGPDAPVVDGDPDDGPGPWAVRPLADGSYGRLLHLALVLGADVEVLDGIVEVAQRHGLAVLDGEGRVLGSDDVPSVGSDEEVPTGADDPTSEDAAPAHESLPRGWRRTLDRTITVALAGAGVPVAYRTSGGLSEWWLGTTTPRPGPVFVLDRVHGWQLRGLFCIGDPSDPVGPGTWRQLDWHPSRRAYRSVVTAGPMGPHDRVARSRLHWWLGGDLRGTPPVVDPPGLAAWSEHVLPEVVAHARVVLDPGR